MVKSSNELVTPVSVLFVTWGWSILFLFFCSDRVYQMIAIDEESMGMTKCGTWLRYQSKHFEGNWLFNLSIGIKYS